VPRQAQTPSVKLEIDGRFSWKISGSSVLFRGEAHELVERRGWQSMDDETAIRALIGA
jgi:hypothetical protein